MPTAVPALTSEVLTIRPWTDELIDSLGHDPRSAYVERFWLGILGPSAVWLLRRLAAGLESSPSGFTLPLADTARSLGIGGQGASSPFVRTLGRICTFDLARLELPDTLAVRRRLPPLARRHLARLPEALQAEHRVWQEADLRTPELDRQRRRARKLALSLVALGEDLEAVERQLLRWRNHPAVSRDAALWAWREHAHATTAGDDPDPPMAA